VTFYFTTDRNRWLMGILIAAVAIFLSRVNPERSRQRATATAAAFDPGSPDCGSKARLHIIRAPADEASLALGAGQVLHGLSSVVGTLVHRVVGRLLPGPHAGNKDLTLEYWFRMVFLLTGGLSWSLLLLLDDRYSGGLAWNVLRVIIAVAGILFTLPFVTLFAVGVMTFPLTALNALVLRVFGCKLDWPAALYLRVTVESAPVGTHTFTQLPWKMPTGLHHSRTWHDPDACAEIERWLRACRET
jgi:hypothetical protein